MSSADSDALLNQLLLQLSAQQQPEEQAALLDLCMERLLPVGDPAREVLRAEQAVLQRAGSVLREEAPAGEQEFARQCAEAWRALLTRGEVASEGSALDELVSRDAPPAVLSGPWAARKRRTVRTVDDVVPAVRAHLREVEEREEAVPVGAVASVAALKESVLRVRVEVEGGDHGRAIEQDAAAELPACDLDSVAPGLDSLNVAARLLPPPTSQRFTSAPLPTVRQLADDLHVLCSR